MVILFAIVLLWWIAFSILDGMEEARHMDVRDSQDTNYKLDSHRLWTGQRLVFWSFICLFLHLSCLDWTRVLGSLALPLMFPLFHDGAYYTERNRLSGVSPRKWLTDHNTSPAKFSIQRFWIRLLLAGLGIGAMIFILIINL